MKFLSLFAMLAVAQGASNKLAVIGSRHDLSINGAGPVRSGEPSACTFCHAPHNVSATVTPLWDHALSSQTYTTYTSSTYNSGPQAPSGGSSKLCLSCHDGTVAVGLTITKGLVNTSGSMDPSDVFASGNLSISHPLGMKATDDGSLALSLFATPATTKDPAVKLVNGRVECTTCHDPHMPRIDPIVPMFLTRSNANGAMCLACHDSTRPQPNVLNGWSTSSHATAGHTVPTTTAFGRYGNIASNACSSCHNAHNNAVGPRNQRGLEEAACTPCHSGANTSPALVNITAEFSKTYRHPTMSVAGVHDPTESLPVNNTRHAECADCHNSHAASAQTGSVAPPAIQSPMANVSGWGTSGQVNAATKEYEVCFKCHADSSNKPASSAYGRTSNRYPAGSMPATIAAPQPPKPADPLNLRLKFMSPISHNVMGFSVPTTSNTTLRPFMLNTNGTSNTSRPLNTTSIIYCTDCHNNDQARSAGGSGTNGPHGSSNIHLLALNLYQEPVGGGSGNNTSGRALCNKCHNLTNLNNISPHDEHTSYGCITCHDPHGVIGGTPAANRALINFDVDIATQGNNTYYGHYSTGATRGCYTVCHGKRHNPERY